MAKRESHAVEISLIVFVILTAISLMVALGAWVKLNRVAKENTDLQARAQKADNDLRTVERESQVLRTMLGFSPQESIQAIEESFAKDRGLYAAGLDEPQQNYRGIQSHLFNVASQRAQEILKAEENARNLQQQLERARAEEVATTEQLRAAADAARQELESMRAQLTEQQRKDDDQKQEVLRQLAQRTSAMDKLRTESQAKVADLENQLAQTRRQLDRLKRDLDEVSQDTFEAPDGRITWVDQRAGTVWVNLGREDGLRPNLSFDVFARDENNLNTAIKKGRIEITNVRNGHTAEAKIVDDSNRNPILADDLIASRLWNPGTYMRFALVGKMDVNHDGRDDRDQVRSLLRRYGNVIDAEDNPDGTVTGEVTIHTRYLVVGERPTDTSDPAQLKAFTQLMDAGTRNNVELISVDKVIDAMGLGRRVRGTVGAEWAAADRAGSASGRRAATPPAAATPSASTPGRNGSTPASPAAAAPAAPSDPLDSGFGDPALDDADAGAGDDAFDDPFAEPENGLGDGATSQRTVPRRERW